MKKKVCIAIPPNLPMPAVKGGAIETLLQHVIDLNEKNYDCDLTIISLYDPKALKKSQQYKHTRFVYYHFKKDDKIKYFMFRGFRKALKLSINILEPYEHFITNYVLKNDFDIFVNESADFNSFEKIAKKLGKENCFAHLHSVFSSNSTIDNTFGTIISVSEFIKQNWLKSSELKSSQVKVLFNCADDSIFNKVTSSPDRKKLREKLGFKSTDFIVIFSGRIVQEKGVLELIRAIKRIKNNKIKLLIVGSPNFGKKTVTKYETQVVKEVEKSKERISFTGFIPHNELYKYYNIAQCAVIPSMYEDPAPLVTIESMMARKPLIVTNSGGIPEYVDSKSAIVVKKEKDIVNQLSQGIVDLYENSSLRSSMSKGAHQRALNYTVDRYYNEYLKILKVR